MKQQRLTFLISLFLFVSVLGISAQPQLQPLPIDPKVRYGTLDNGLTYYIRHNELPKQRAEFFIAQKVGSVLEMDNQAGLAHFLEHMAFNGTKNLPGKTMINYLETIGVKFGENLNAYTSFDRTVYNVSNVPLTREGIIDTCLLVLHDWSGCISLEDKEIDNERGVILEEMRSRSSAGLRQMETLLPEIMSGSQYAKRMPIGTEAVVSGFKYQELRDYYHKWYRPDLQAVIVIGDVDVDQIEAKLKTLFADIPKPVNPAERIYYPVADNKEPLVGIATDKEATGTDIDIYYKHDPLPKELKASAAGMGIDLIESFIARMISARFGEIVQKANPPFLGAGGRDGQFIVAETKEAMDFYARAKEGEVEKSLKALVAEIQKIKQFGFVDSELERAKTGVLKSYESQYNERDKQQNRRYAQEYVSHFCLGGYIPGIEKEYELVKQIVPAIPVQAINKYIQEKIRNENIVISLTAPQKEGLVTPTREQLLAWYEEAGKAKVEAYVDNVSNEPLIAKLPTPGKIVSAKEDKTFGTTVYKFKNGVTAVIKPTTFKDDEIQMSATSPGGSSHFPETEMTNMKFFGSVVGLGGVGNFSNVELRKVLTGKRAGVNPYVDLQFEGFSGSSSVADFETMLQLTYLYFTAPRMDQDAFESFMGRMKSQLESAEVNPANALNDTLTNTLYSFPERHRRLTPADIDKVNYQLIMDWYKDRFKDAGDFTFVFVGNIDPKAAAPVLEQYLGSLPSINRKETDNKNIHNGLNKGKFIKAFDKTMETPKAVVYDCYSGTMDYSLLNRMKMDMLSQILRIVYTEKVREDEGGTYGVSVGGSISHSPLGSTMLRISFETNAEKKDYLNDIVKREFKNMAEKGPRIEDFNKTKEFMLKKFNENLQENSYWRSVILNYYQIHQDSYTNYLKDLNAITPADIQKFAKDLLDQDNFVQIIMNGVKAN